MLPTESSRLRTLHAHLLEFFERRLHDGPAAQDLVQDVLLRVLERGDQLAEDTRFEAWVDRIARNVLVDHLRRRRDTADLEPDGPMAGDPDEHAANREVAGRLAPMIAELPEAQREVLTLAELEALPLRQVAARLGLSLPATKSRVQRARALLKERLLACCRIDVDSFGNVLAWERRGERCAPRCTGEDADPGSCG